MKLSCLTLSTLALLAPMTLVAAEIKPFTFIQMSDMHLQSSETTMSRNLKKAYADIEANFPDAAFVVSCGDLTECGYKSEFDHYVRLKKDFSKPIYDTNGNHDSVWSENGKENYRDALGDNYRMTDYNGVRFVNMDSSVLLEHYGHFDGTQMSRLRQAMDTREPGQPMFVSFHHPLNGSFVDNSFTFIDAIRNKNVPLVMTGHGHTFSQDTINGTTYAMGGSTFGVASYRVWKVDGKNVTGFVRNFLTEQSGEVDTTVPLQMPILPENILAISKAENGTVEFTLSNCEVSSTTEVSYTIDGTFSENIKRGDAASYKTKNHPIPAGLHRLSVRLTDDKGNILSEMKTFNTTNPNNATPRLIQTVTLPSGAQSSPVIDGDSVLVGCNDGKLYCYNTDTLAKKWEADLEREILGAPVVADGKVYVGSLSKFVFCLNATDGSIIWKAPVGGAVLSAILVTDKFIITGGGDGGVHALDRATGKSVWRYQSNQFVQMTPTLADDGKSIVFGGWDNQIVKLNIETGEKLWSAVGARAAILGCATARVAVDGGVAVCNSHDKKVRGLSIADGSTLWTWNPPNPTFGPSFSSPVIYNGVSYAGSINGILYGYDVKTGAVVTEIKLRPEQNDAVFDGSPRIVDGKAYIGTVGGNVYCVDLTAKKVDWSVALQPGFIFTTPAYKDGKLYVSSMGNALFVIETPAAK